MPNPYDEILEAIWKAGERADSSVASVRRQCAVELNDSDLENVCLEGLAKRDDSGIHLTARGSGEARAVVRRHRLAEVLVATVPHVDENRQETIACELEHDLPAEAEEGICSLLGHPTQCPHGHSIPPGKCCPSREQLAVNASPVVCLTSLGVGEKGRIAYIRPRHHERLRRLTAFGLTPGTEIRLTQRSPAFCVHFEGTELALDRDVAGDIFVAKAE